ncbi:MAG: PIN domain-containing protein [Chloroflexi bacterium]|nr:PIN domain-containing protein [Chloroflexota bacterium]
MRVCIDSNQFIFGISGTNPASEKLMAILPFLEVVIPRLVLQEVSRNLSKTQVKSFYALLKHARVKIVEEPVPADLVNKYVSLGLREKADAFIGAFVEWQNAAFLISSNRQFLAELSTKSFQVLRPDEFLTRHFLER